MPRMGDLAQQDTYDVDWSKYNQPMGELKDPNPVAYKTRAKAINVSPQKAVEWWSQGKIPLAGLAGAAPLMGGLLGQQDDNQ